MKKRILNLLVCLLVMAALLPIEVSAVASMEIKVVPEKETAAPGEKVDYAIYAGPVEHMQSGQFELYVPEGLTYIANSAKLAKGITDRIGAASVDWTEQTYMFTFYGIGDYASKEDTLLMTFSCTVDDDAVGSLTASVAEEVFGDINYEEFSVTVEAAPVKVAEAVEVESSAASESTMASQQTGDKNQNSQSTEGNVQGNDAQTSQPMNDIVQEIQKESAAEGMQSDQTGVEKQEASIENTETKEKGTSWWWLAVLIVGGAGIGASVYYKNKKTK